MNEPNYDKSPIDELFYELYGYYPSKKGKAYEMIVAAVLKLVYDADVGYDRHVKGEYSKTDYQQDSVVEKSKKETMVEAKDYTLKNKKVGRGELQKLQGALSDLDVERGIFASATGYTKPALKYGKSSEHNPKQQYIDTFHVRPTGSADVSGRIRSIVIDAHAFIPDYANAYFRFVPTPEAIKKLQQKGLIDGKFAAEELYDGQGNILISIAELSRHQPPYPTFEKNFMARGCWITHKAHCKIDGQYYEMIGIEYNIPFIEKHDEIVIKAEGNPKFYIRNEKGEIDKIITDTELKKVKFENGKVLLDT